MISELDIFPQKNVYLMKNKRINSMIIINNNVKYIKLIIQVMIVITKVTLFMISISIVLYIQNLKLTSVVVINGLPITTTAKVALSSE